MIALYSCTFTLGIFLVYFLVYRKNPHGFHSINVFTYCYALYTLSIPISYFFFENSFLYIEQFLFIQNLGIYGVLLSIVAARSILPHSKYHLYTFTLKNQYLFFASLLLFIAMYFIYLQTFKGGVVNYLTVGYQYGEDSSTLEKVFGVFSIHPLSALISVWFISSYGNNRYNTIMCLGIAFLFTVLLSAGGHRNLALWLLSPLLMYACYKKLQLKIVKSMIFTFIIYLTGMLVGVFRHYGFGDIDGFKEALSGGAQIFDPRSQELVTSYNVMTYWFDGSAAKFWLYPFESYILGLINLLPKFIFPVSDTSIADNFSTAFAAPGEGLGFSINLEALLNFGVMGPFIIGFILGGLLYWLNRSVFNSRFKLVAFCIYLNLPAVALNLNRIDFATVIKLLMIKVIFMVLVFFIFIISKRKSFE